LLLAADILYAQWPANSKSRKLGVSFSVDRQEIRQKNMPTKEPNWNHADYAEYLRPTSRRRAKKDSGLI
jgi:hypothetical protein